MQNNEDTDERYREEFVPDHADFDDDDKDDLPVDLTAPIYAAVKEAERNFYTRAEIAAALRTVADDISPSGSTASNSTDNDNTDTYL